MTNEVRGEVTYRVKETEVDVLLTSLRCTSCDNTYDFEDLELIQDEDDDSQILAICPDCDEILATFSKE